MNYSFASLLLTGASMFVFGSCLKSDYDSNRYTLKGRILSNNTGQPVEGLQLMLYTPLKGLGSSGGGEEIGNTYTDSNGNFVMGGIKTIHSKNLKFFGNFIPAFTITPVPRNGDTIDRGDIYINE